MYRFTAYSTVAHITARFRETKALGRVREQRFMTDRGLAYPMALGRVREQCFLTAISLIFGPVHKREQL